MSVSYTHLDVYKRQLLCVMFLLLLRYTHKKRKLDGQNKATPDRKNNAATHTYTTLGLVYLFPLVTTVYYFIVFSCY